VSSVLLMLLKLAYVFRVDSFKCIVYTYLGCCYWNVLLLANFRIYDDVFYTMNPYTPLVASV